MKAPSFPSVFGPQPKDPLRITLEPSLLSNQPFLVATLNVDTAIDEILGSNTKISDEDIPF
ncbi:MAG: hypothetical protein DMG72_01840 [Acidobacteria bacterium]|nr:MAG: hypothetical protein DMG72_01840 [Acidobacteriota bacterium]